MSGDLRIPRGRFLTLTGAGAAASIASWRIDPAAAQSTGKTLTVAIPTTPTTLDPINMITHDPMVITQSIFENLVEYDVDGILRPQLAKELPEISRDKLVYTFDLRDDVYFHNGQKLTAEDVKYSFESMLDPRRNAARRGIFARISRVEVDSPSRVRVHLSEPYAPWLDFLTKFMGIWPKGSREQLGDDHFKLQPTGIGTGPGIFEEWRPNDYISLRRNPNYWRKGVPHWDRLVVKIVPEDETRIAYLTTGQVDIIAAPPPRDFGRLEKQNGITGAVRTTLGGWSVIMLNTRRPPFDDVNFRKAMAFAIDRNTIAKDVYFGFVEPTAVPAPPGSWWYDQKADDMIQFDLDKARAYLKKSKYPQGATFEMTLPSTPYLLDAKDAAIVIQSQLAKLNIRPVLKMAEVNVVLPQAIRGEHHALFMNLMSPGEPTYLTMVNLTANQMMTKCSYYTNPRIDQLLRASYAETDHRKLKPIFAELARFLAEQSPYIWLGFFNAANLWRGSVKDFKVNQGLSMVVRDTVPS